MCKQLFSRALSTLLVVYDDFFLPFFFFLFGRVGRFFLFFFFPGSECCRVLLLAVADFLQGCSLVGSAFREVVEIFVDEGRSRGLRD